MADWFKFYENDLDETRLQYAISKMPEVVSVWVGILSEACRHKSGTISWGDDAIELFGFSRRLGLTVPKVNEGVNLLCEIRYISKAENRINILKWNDKQSEYCQWKEKRKASISESVPTVSRQCPSRGEERRGEDNRVEEKSGLEEPHAHYPEIEIPSWEEVKATAVTIGLPEWRALDWFNEMQAVGWKDRNRRDIMAWRPMLATIKAYWERDGRHTSPPSKSGKNGEMRPMDIKTIIQAKETLASQLRTQFCSDTAIDAAWSNPQKKQEFFKLKREIKQLNTQLSNLQT